MINDNTKFRKFSKVGTYLFLLEDTLEARMGMNDLKTRLIPTRAKLSDMRAI
jgi:hypothetical protein